MQTKQKHLFDYLPHDTLSFLGCVCILCGMFLSRAMISIGMMTLIGNAILDTRVGTHAKSFFKKPYLWLLSGYFILLLCSGLWSSDLMYFKERILVALPFLILPFAFHCMNAFSSQKNDFIFYAFIVLTTFGIGWSLLQYVQHKEAFDTAYGFSKVIPTPFKNDHIRFSLAVVFSICFSVDLMLRIQSKGARLILVLLAMLSIIYLHILAAKTGLLVFYMLAILFLIKGLTQKPYRIVSIGAFTLLILLPISMYFLSPSLRNKLSYAEYSFYEIKNHNKDARISDQGRLVSYEYALDCIRKHPFIGVGIGDIKQEMANYFEQDRAQQKGVFLLPHNQFLMMGMALGIGGILYLLWMQWILFKQCKRQGFLSMAIWCALFFTMMIEPLFETQYGTCMFLFVLLLLLHRRLETA